MVANSYVADVQNTAIVELYNITDNITDNIAVTNGKITTSNLFNSNGYLQTGNVYNALPDKEITLGISLKSGNAGMFAASGSCYLLLYRR